MYTNRHSDAIAVKALEYLYNYTTPEDNIQNMKKLQRICTPDVFNELTYTNFNQISTYEIVQAYKEPTTVEILKKGNGYIIYRINSTKIARNCNFIFAYNVAFGKIISANNGEFNDFYTDFQYIQ